MNGVEYAHVPARISTVSNVAAPSFGVYRAAESDWHAEMLDVIDELQLEGRKVLRSTGFSERAKLWRGKRTLGLTYVERGRMQDEQLEGVDFGKLVRRIGEITTGSAEVEVPIDRVAWGGYRRTVLAAFLADGYELRQLAEEREAVADVLDDAGLPSDMVKLPDHVSLARFNIFPGIPNRLQDSHRTAIKRIAARQLVTASIHSVVVSNLLIGEGYNMPFHADDWLVEEPTLEMTAALGEGYVTGGSK